MQQQTKTGGLGRAATSGVIWLFVQSVCARGLGFVSQIFLAWLLMPADFGMIGLAYTVTSIAGTLVSFGVDDVLLQRQRSIALWSTPAFWISLCLGTLGMVGMLIIAPVAAGIYHSPNLVGLVALMAIAMPVRALATVPMVKIRSMMDFRFLAAYNTFEIAALQLGTILLAWAGFGAYSFAIPVPALALFKTVLFWWKAPPVIGRRFRMVQLRYLFSNSTVVFFTRAMLEVVSQGDYIVLGLLASKSVVGLYFFAFRFSVQPVRMLAGNFTNVLFPAFAQLRGDTHRQADAAYRASRLLAYLVMPFCFLQAALAGPGLHLLFGNRWYDAIPLVQILSVGLPFDAVSWITGSLMSARREFGRAFRFVAISTPLFFLAAGVGAWLDGALGTALGVDLYYLIYPPLCSVLILKSGGIRPRQITELYAMPALLAGGAVGIGYLASLLPFIRGSDIIRVVVISTIASLLYAMMLRLWRRDMLNQLVDRVTALLGNIDRKRQSLQPIRP